MQTITRTLATLLLLSWLPAATAAPSAKPWPLWEAHDAASQQNIEHGAWDRWLSQWVEPGADGINRVDYGRIGEADRAELRGYIDALAALEISRYNRAEQQAYWINLYNALTVQLILDNPDVSSIRKIKDGLFSIGPWGRDIIVIDGQTLTLNDIEHRILRPLYGDARIHFAVNCASLGCPNLQPVAWTADNLETLYDAGARAFINHPRGVSVKGDRLTLSSIFSWFDEDFGEGRREVLDWIAQFAEPELAQTLKGWTGRVRYDYDWDLNAPE